MPCDASGDWVYHLLEAAISFVVAALVWRMETIGELRNAVDRENDAFPIA